MLNQIIIFVYGYYIKQITTKPKTIKLVFVASPLKHVALRRKGKDWLARNQDNVSEWDNVSSRGLLFQWVSGLAL